MKEISLRPYTGKLFYVRTKKEYEQAHIDLFKEPDILSCSSNGGRALVEDVEKTTTGLI